MDSPPITKSMLGNPQLYKSSVRKIHIQGQLGFVVFVDSSPITKLNLKSYYLSLYPMPQLHQK